MGLLGGWLEAKVGSNALSLGNTKQNIAWWCKIEGGCFLNKVEALLATDAVKWTEKYSKYFLEENFHFKDGKQWLEVW